MGMGASVSMIGLHCVWVPKCRGKVSFRGIYPKKSVLREYLMANKFEESLQGQVKIKSEGTYKIEVINGKIDN